MNYSELLQLAKGWGNFISDRIIIWRLRFFARFYRCTGVKTGFGEDLDIFTKMEGGGGQVERRDESVLFCGGGISREQGI